MFTPMPAHKLTAQRAPLCGSTTKGGYRRPQGYAVGNRDEFVECKKCIRAIAAQKGK
jgi:hypothetical protein